MSNYMKIFSLTKDLSVLFVEDHQEIRDSMVEILQHYFKIVTTANDGKEGIEEYLNFYNKSGKYYDLIITDIEMPNVNGISLVKEIRKINQLQEIVVLSAHDESHYLLELINIGVTQYITKPLEIEQLLESFYKVGERLKSTLQKELIIEIDHKYSYNKTKKSLYYNGNQIKLTKHETILLEVLAKNFENICTTEKIISHFIQSNSQISPNNLRFLILKLRKKLPPNSIETLYSVGYRLKSVKEVVGA